MKNSILVGLGMNTAWSETKKWWMDLIKWTVTFFLGALLSYFIVDKLEDQRLQKRAKEDASFRLKLSSAQEFQRALASYDVAAVSAYTELYQWKGKLKTPAMEWYERQAYAGWIIAIEDIEKRFASDKSIQQAISELRSANKERHIIYDHWVDHRLDNADNTPIDPKSTREKFNDLSKKIAQLRGEIVEKIEGLILKGQ